VLALDLVVGAVIVASVAWGVTRGMTVDALTLVGAGAGAVLGARVVVLLLNGGLHASDAPEIAIPAAGIGAVIGAMIAERAGLRAQRTRRRRPGQTRRTARLRPAEKVGGALLGAVLGVSLAWILGGVLAQVESLRADVRRSEILGHMYAVLAPPGPSLAAPVVYTDPFPSFHANLPAMGPIRKNITHDPAVLAATHSLVKVVGVACHHGVQGTGWFAGDGIVVTNAHVIGGASVIGVEPGGRGPFYRATPIWFQPKYEIGVLRVPALAGRPPLPMAARAVAETSAAIIGFPLHHFRDRPVLVGATTTTISGQLGNQKAFPPEFPPQLFGRPITVFAGLSQPGNSGSPLVDAHGRVLALVFAGDGQNSGLAMAINYVRYAVAHAGPAVSTGPCPRGRI
jgi:hypothetical protein